MDYSFVFANIVEYFAPSTVLNALQNTNSFNPHDNPVTPVYR